MDASVRPDLGPSLPAVTRSLWRRLATRGRIALAAGIASLIAVLGFGLHALLSEATFTYRGPAAPAFSLSYRGLHRVAARGDELVRLEAGGDQRAPEQRLTVSPVRLTPSGLPVATSLPQAAAGVARRAISEFPAAHLDVEGRARLLVDHGLKSYQVGFLAPASAPGRAAGVLIGKVLIVPERGDQPGRALAIELVETTYRPKLVEAARTRPAGLLLNYPNRDLEQVEIAAETSGDLERALKGFRLL